MTNLPRIILSTTLFATSSFALLGYTPEDVGQNQTDHQNTEADADNVADSDTYNPDIDASDLPNAPGAGGHDLLPWPSDQHFGRTKRPSSPAAL